MGATLATLINLSLGFALSMLVVKFPGQKIALIVIAVIVGLLVTISTMLSKKEEPKKTIEDIKEGEIYWVLCQTIGVEGNLALVRNKKTKELKLLVFKEPLPTIFKKEKGKIVPYEK